MRGRVHTSFVIGRLQNGATLEQARQELSSLAVGEERSRVWVSPLQKEIGYKLRPALLALFLATGCVLLIACANLANLLLSQVATRRPELTIRSALGAGRQRIIRQLLVEALVVLLAGIGAGVASAKVISRTMTALYPDAIPRAGEGGSHAIAYLLALAATLVVGLLFGTMPAWRAASEANEAGLRVGNLWMSRGSRR
jgi:predicted lysophospholipase L1 biosynthesis ABC-type transport system permease subunit